MMLYDSLKLHVKLRNLREIHNMTREELADKLQLSIKSISDIETGKTNITVKRLVDYCNIFNCNLEDILNFNVSQIFNFHVVQQPNANSTNINHQQIQGQTDAYEQLLKLLHSRVEQLEKQNSDFVAIIMRNGLNKKVDN